MILQSTKKVLDLFRVKPEPINEDTSIFSWHVNWINVNRKKMLIMVHDITRFCVLVYGVKKSDKNNLIKIIKDAMYVSMKSEAYSGFTIKYYLDQSDRITFTKTRSRHMISSMNWTTTLVEYFLGEEGYIPNSYQQAHITTIINRDLTLDKNTKEYFKPGNRMCDLLEEFQKTQKICYLDEDYWNIKF